MLLVKPLHELYRSSGSILVNWINTIGSCVEPSELLMKELYPKNYIKYISRDQCLKVLNFVSINPSQSLTHSILIDPNDFYFNNKFIFNCIISDFPNQPISIQDITSIIRNIILSAQFLSDKFNIIPNFESFDIPLLKSYNSDITEEIVVNTIRDTFYNASISDVTLYK